MLKPTYSSLLHPSSHIILAWSISRWLRIQCLVGNSLFVWEWVNDLWEHSLFLFSIYHLDLFFTNIIFIFWIQLKLITLSYGYKETDTNLMVKTNKFSISTNCYYYDSNKWWVECLICIKSNTHNRKPKQSSWLNRDSVLETNFRVEGVTGIMVTGMEHTRLWLKWVLCCAHHLLIS